MIQLENYKRIVIKIGSSLIIDSANNKLRDSWLKNLAKEIACLRKKGVEIVIVSSGAIACACKFFNVKKAGLSIEQKQAFAAFGQAELIKILKKIFSSKRVDIAQILITGEDCEDRRRYLNMRATLDNLLNLNIVPVINENDTVITQEIKFGDNDNLSSQVVGLIDADLLILLSDVKGLYDMDPKKNKDAKIVKAIKNVNEKIMSLASTSKSEYGTGGMHSKLLAAKNANKFGADVIITNGLERGALLNLEKSSDFSLFEKSKKAISAKKKWLLHLKTSGKKIIINNCAVTAVKEKNSLLPVGINSLKGKFERGDVVDIVSDSNEAVAKGLVSLDSVELKEVVGKNSFEIAKLNKSYRSEAVHIDNMVLY
jgi:glutamate 5-kinase